MLVDFVADGSKLCLSIQKSEFLKASEKENEFDSLQMAINAFAALNYKEHILTHEEYNALVSWLEKDSYKNRKLLFRWRGEIFF